MATEENKTGIQESKTFGEAIRKGVPSLADGRNITNLADLKLRQRQARAAMKEAREMLADNFDLIDNKYFGDRFRSEDAKESGDKNDDVRRTPLISGPLRLIAGGVISSLVPTPMAAGGAGLAWSVAKMAGSYVARKWLKNKADDAISGIVGLMTKKKDNASEQPQKIDISHDDVPAVAPISRAEERKMKRSARMAARSQEEIEKTIARAEQTSREMKAAFKLRARNASLPRPLTEEEKEARAKVVARARAERESLIHDYGK